jgi:drug/metabolite transporter (DMT)-like permease
VSGIAASRRLGPRLASFVALLEVLSGLVFAWLLLGQLLTWVQFAGGLLVLAGVVTVKAGERDADLLAPLVPTVSPVA